MRVLGHRGARLVAPENTVPAFLAALAEGADGVELDVRWTADRILVCLHDSTVGRTTDGHGPLRALGLEALRRLDAGAAFERGGRYPFRGRGLRVPTLVEALDALPESALVNVEVKLRGEGAPGAGAVAARLAADLAGRADRGRLVVSSFSRRVAAAIALALPDVRTGLVTPAVMPLGRALRALEASGGSVLSAQAAAYFGPRAAATCDRARAAGVLLAAWTVDDPAVARRLRGLGVELLVSDRPGRLRGALSGGLARTPP